MKRARIRLLFKNLIKQNIKNRVQVIIMIILLLITSLVFMSTVVCNKMINNAEINTNIKSNLHDFVIDLNSANGVGDNTDNHNAESFIKQNAIESASNLKNNKFIWDRVETRNFYLGLGNSQKTLKIVIDNKDAKVDKLVVIQGTNIGNNANIKVAQSQQAVVDPTFAKKNNIKIGSIIRLQKDHLGSSIVVNSNSIVLGYNWFQVVGFGDSADMKLQ